MFGASLVSEQVMKMSREEWEQGAAQAQGERVPLSKEGYGRDWSPDSLMVYEPVWQVWNACDEGIKPSTAARLVKRKQSGVCPPQTRRFS